MDFKEVDINSPAIKDLEYLNDEIKELKKRKYKPYNTIT